MNFTIRQIRDFWAKVKVGAAGECWLWQGAVINSGYGVKNVAVSAGKYRMLLAHRVAWEIFNSEIPEGLVCCHHCDVKTCCNPGHLFLGTHKDNTQDMMAKDRGNRRQFTAEQAQQAKKLRAEGWHVRDIAREMGCSTSPIMRALKGFYDVKDSN